MRVLGLIIALAVSTTVAGGMASTAYAADDMDRRDYIGRDDFEDDRYTDDRFKDPPYQREAFRTRDAGLKDDYEPVEPHYSTKDGGYIEPRDDVYREERRHEHFRGHRDRALYTPGITRRLEAQKRRVHRANDHGQLTRRELVEIRDCVEDIRAALHHARQDGIVTRRERRRIHTMLDDSARLIAQLKNNRRFARY